MPDRSYAILGTGALGGYYGARLHHAGCDVRFLLHSDYRHVAAHGLKVESKDGDFSILEPQAYDDPARMPPVDVAVVCLKTTHNHLLPKLIRPVLKPDGAVLMMQNGLDIEQAAAEVAPGAPILGGLAFLCSNKVGPGHIHHLDYGAIRLGAYRTDGAPAGVTDLMRAVGADFERAGIPIQLEEDLVLARWKKLVWNITYNGLSVIHQCTTDVLMGDPEKRAMCEAVMREVLAAAAGCGRIIDPGFITFMMQTTDKMASYQPSMLLDDQQRRPLEIQAIYGNPLAAARAAGVDCPLISQIHEKLIERDRANRSG